ncbi:MAG: M42 family metallopeptidase [Candidatus Muiribacteriaceae bacterium]
MNYLKALSELDGPAGFERKVSDYVLEHFRDSGNLDECGRDRLGNVFGIKKGRSDKRLMIAAHMDEVGFIINYVDSNGFMKFELLGGIVNNVIPNSRVRIIGTKGTVTGVIGVNPPHVAGKDKITYKDLFIDTGLDRDGLEKNGIGIGSYAVFDTDFQTTDNVFIGKAFDDRVGVAVLLHIAAKLKEKTDYTIVLCATVQEEVGMRGGAMAGRNMKPDIALIFEGTYALDTLGNPPDVWTSYFGKGPAMTIMDRTMIADRYYLDVVEKYLKKGRIKYQYKQPRNAGGTDAGKIHLEREGVPCCVLAAPCRYIHSAYTMLNREDYDNMKKAGLYLCRNLKHKEIDNIYK